LIEFRSTSPAWIEPAPRSEEGLGGRFNRRNSRAAHPQNNDLSQRSRSTACQNVFVMPPYRQRFFNIETVGIVTVVLSVLCVAYLLYSIW
jgi:hypothetical protein